MEAVRQDDDAVQFEYSIILYYIILIFILMITHNVCIYVCIYIEREGERERDIHTYINVCYSFRGAEARYVFRRGNTSVASFAFLRGGISGVHK